MAYFVCVSCKCKVEDGAVACPSCHATLSPPGALMQTLGWVILALSLVPFSVGEVTGQEGNYIPVFIAVACAVLGIIMVVTGKAKNRAAAPTVVQESPGATGKA